MDQVELEFLKDSEAREWKDRFRKKVAEVGSLAAKAWWDQVCQDIESIRGRKGLEDLRWRMNKK